MHEPSGPILAGIVGVWRLRKYFDVAPGCPIVHPFGPHPEGLLIYTADGYVSAQLMSPGRPPFNGNGFIGYSGTYVVDEAGAMVTHFPVVAFSPQMVGTAQKRALQITRDSLLLVASHPKVANLPQTESHLEWKRVTTSRQRKAE